MLASTVKFSRNGRSRTSVTDPVTFMRSEVSESAEAVPEPSGPNSVPDLLASHIEVPYEKY